jgi:hypothetical protein
MKTYSAARDSLFLGSTFMSIVNVVLVILSAIHHKDPWVRLPLFTILLAVVVIWAVYARFGNELDKVCSQGTTNVIKVRQMNYLLNSSAGEDWCLPPLCWPYPSG